MVISLLKSLPHLNLRVNVQKNRFGCDTMAHQELEAPTKLPKDEY